MRASPAEEGWIGQRLSTSEAFDSYASAFGGVAEGRPFEPEDIGAQEHYLISLLAWEQLAKSRLPNALGEDFVAHFGFIESGNPDAFAETIAGVHFCGINTGLMRLSTYLADETVLLRDVYPDFGKPIGDEDDTLDLVPDADSLSARMALASELRFTRSTRRIMASRYFAHYLIAFAMFHEFNHAISGHSAFVRLKLGASRLHEYGSLDARIGDEVQREVEYTADIGAIESMFDYIQRGTVLSRLFPTRFKPVVQHRLFLTALATLCATWHGMNQRFGRDALHPDPAARWATCVRLYTMLLQEHYPIRWASIGRSAVADIGRLAVQCPQLLELLTNLSAYGEDSPYWERLEPGNLLVDRDKILPLAHPPVRQPRPYRSKALRKAIRPAV